MTSMVDNNRLPEPILEPDNTRFTQLPIKYPVLQDAYDNFYKILCDK